MFDINVSLIICNNVTIVIIYYINLMMNGNLMIFHSLITLIIC